MTPRKLESRCDRVTLLAICASLLCSPGCQNATVRRADGLEARLREQQTSIDRLAASLEQVESDRDVARREASILRDELVKLQPSPEILQTAHSTSRIDRIEVVPLLSGGLDRDEIPGDEQISLLIAPKDSSGEIHRVSGELSVRLTDVSLPAGSEDLVTANFSESESEALWHNGIVGRGFRILIPLPASLKNRNLTVHVRFKTIAGAQLDTLHQLQVSPEATNTPAIAGD